MTARRVLCLLAAAAAAAWCAYNVATLATDGVFFKPGGRLGPGMWIEAAGAATVCAVSMTIYALVPAILLYFGLRRPSAAP